MMFKLFRLLETSMPWVNKKIKLTRKPEVKKIV